MTIFGIRKLRSVSRNVQRISPGDPALLVLTSLATATVAQGLLFATAFPQWAECLNS